MDRLANRYHPMTGTPFQADETYREYAPCDALKPYIRCFWGTETAVYPSDIQPECGIVIPDTCMDIIFDMNFTKNTNFATFCGLDDTSQITWGQKGKEKTATFGIRFYAWTAVLFAEGDMRHTQNARMSCAAFSGTIERALKPYMTEFDNIRNTIQRAEKVLIGLLRKERADHNVLNAIDMMLMTCGRAKIKDLTGYTGITQRTLERDFERMLGISPKLFSSLLRYQMVWQEIVNGRFHMLDAVEKYGYTDQAHLLHDFRKRHLMNPGEAMRFAVAHK